jgi:hypothetical protein
MTKRKKGGGGFEILRRGLEALRHDLETGRLGQRAALVELLTDLPEVLTHIETYIDGRHEALLREVQARPPAEEGTTPARRPPARRTRRRAL